MPDEKRIAERLGPQFVGAARAASITTEMVRSAREKGVGYICANCVKFWWGIEKGHAQCKALFERTKCGGPMAELAFPQYEGLIPREKFPTLCFVCGREADAAVHIHGVEDMVGVCKEHEEYIHAMRPHDPNEKQEIILKTRMEVPT